LKSRGILKDDPRIKECVKELEYHEGALDRDAFYQAVK